MPKKLPKKIENFIIQKLKRHLSGDDKYLAYLFGSYAKGKARKNSDIDIAVKGKKPLPLSTWSNLESEFEESDLPMEVDLVDYSRVQKDFQKIIDKEGKRIYQSKPKVHPARICPVGEHWVRPYPKTIESARKGSYTTIVDGHCRKNPSRKDILTALEIHDISKTITQYLKKTNVPMPSTQKMGFDDGNKYDQAIAFWTSYWNDIFKPKDKLTPNIVKALIASESSFKEQPVHIDDYGKRLDPRGVMQILKTTRKILRDQKGELKDYLIKGTDADFDEPNLSIAAGIRWLFRKRELAKRRLKHEPSWREAIAEYKGYLPGMRSGKDPNPDGMQAFDKYLKILTDKQ